MNKLYLFSALFFTLATVSPAVFAQKNYTLSSPNGKVVVTVSIHNDIQYSVKHGGDVMIHPSAISMTLADGKTFGKNPQLKKQSQRVINETIPAMVYKKKQVSNHCNEAVFEFKENFNLIFRAYDDGVAYRFVSTLTKPFVVQSEEASFNFPGNPHAYLPYVKKKGKGSLESQFYTSFESVYTYTPLSDWDDTNMVFLPVLIEGANGKKVCITEADLLHYPGMFLYKGKSDKWLKGVFAPVPKEITQGGHNMLQGVVQTRETFIAKQEGPCNFPWRVMIVSSQDTELTNSDMVYRLATPPAAKDDFSWIKPGKVAWDWWNDWNLYNVDFAAGINNTTYKYYIDFASAHKIEYVILDEGWSVNKAADLLQVVPEINLKELVEYANRKNVGLILWAGYYALNRDIEGICKHYSEMGIKGFKVDFMDRDDQPMVKFHADVARIAAKYRLLIDFHGTYKPTGLHRTFPNVINFEGVFGLEQMKWSEPTVDQVTYDVTVPFIRMVAGPMDYTQGAMRNAIKSNYRPVWSEAMSQGTRCRQLAEYVIFESPLNMLCDSPSNYMNEKECTEFIAAVPTVWDNTIALNGKVGEYVTIARQKGNLWYVGSLTNWDSRSIELDLSFLGEGAFRAEIFKDGVNAHRNARDYKKEIIAIPANRKLTVDMVSGGGFVMKIMSK